jgi:hypothetical protein
LLSVLIFKYFRSGYNWGVLVLGNGINSLLVLGVIYELANKLIFSRSSLGPVLRPIFYGSLAVLLLGSAAASGSMTNGAIKRVIQVFETLDFSSSLIEVGLLVVLLVFARTMHIAWGDWTVGIAVGFGVSACMDLASAALRWSYGKRAFIAVDITQMAAYHVCILIWLIYLLLPERPSTLPPGGLQQRDLEKWNEEVEKILPKWYGGVRKKRVMVTDIMSMAGFQACAISRLIYLVLPEPTRNSAISQVFGKRFGTMERRGREDSLQGDLWRSRGGQICGHTLLITDVDRLQGKLLLPTSKEDSIPKTLCSPSAATCGLLRTYCCFL